MKKGGPSYPHLDMSCRSNCPGKDSPEEGAGCGYDGGLLAGKGRVRDADEIRT